MVRKLGKYSRNRNLLVLRPRWGNGGLLRLFRNFGESRLEKLGALRLRDTECTNRSMVEVSRLDLRALDISTTLITRKGLSYLRYLPRLESLNVDSCDIGDSSVKYVTALPKLKHLQIGRTRVSDKGLKQIAGIPDLRSLEISDNPITDRGLGFLKSCEKLTVLGLSEAKLLTNQAMKKVAELSALNDLNLNFVPLGDEAFEYLRPLPLKVLSCYEARIGKEGCEALARLEKLNDLHIGNTGVDNDCLEHLSKLKGLMAFDLTSTEINDDGVSFLCELPDLVEITLTGTTISDKGIERLARVERLRKLHIADTDISDGCGKHIARFRFLENLDIGETAVTDAFVRSLTTLPLECLNISGTAISDRGLAEISRIETLRALTVQKKQFSDAALSDLRSALPNCHIL